MYRLDIQGLRAVAVTLVLIYHLFPTRLSGGFVGVDVFFVISGFLITAHMLREIDQTGRLAVTHFWARRIRRLLPASFLVLLVTALAGFWLLPMSLWLDTYRQIAASGLYVVNWALAGDAISYLAGDGLPTAVQHYWTLSIEEQFYIFWPVLLIIALALARKRSRTPETARRRAMLVLLLVFIISLSYSVYRTHTDAVWAFFDTGTRAWEFAAGGLLATFTFPRWIAGKTGLILGWFGLAAIVAAGYLFGLNTLFPGYAALLPVGGAAVVILTGANTHRFAVGRLLRTWPAVKLGDISYAVYLWHWPLIILGPALLGHALRLADKFVIAMLSLGLAAASTYLLENPLRYGPVLRHRWRAYTLAAVGALLFAGCYLAVQAHIERVVLETGREVAVSESSCTGPGALNPRNNCASTVGAGEFLVPADIVAQPNFNLYYPGCQQGFAGTEPEICEIGSMDPAAARIAIVGDSHIGHWFFGFDEAGQKNNWRITTFAKTSCPPTRATRVLTEEQTTDNQEECAGWQRSVLAELAANDEISVVVVSSYSSAYKWAQPGTGPDLEDPPVDGFAEFFAEIADQGKQVVVIKAVPRTNGLNVPQCLIDNNDDPLACAASREEALPADPMEAAVRKLDRPEVRLVNLDDQFCDAQTCYPVVGDIIAYRDRSHLSSQYSQALMPWVTPALERALELASGAH